VVAVGDELDVEIVRIRDDGKGVAWTPDGKVLLIDGVRAGDGRVRVQVQRTYVQTVFGKAVTRLQEAQAPAPRYRTVESPYAIEGDDTTDEDEDEE